MITPSETDGVRRYNALGDTVNVTARLQSLASDSEVTLGRCIELDPETRRCKGKRRTEVSYRGKDQIPRVYGGLGINILSTSRGLMTGRSAAREGVGGEILCNVW